MNTPADDTLNLALDFLDLNPGCFLFPLKKKASYPPLIKKFHKENASDDPKQIAKWHEEFPGCNWGIALEKSNRLAVDVDVKPGQCGAETYDELNRLYGFPPTETVETPSGGWHHHYKGEHIFALGEGGLGPNVDLPLYVPIPGCKVASGKSYKLLPSAELASAPDWLYEVATKNRDIAEQQSIDQITPLVDLDKPSRIDWAIHYLQEDAPFSIQGRNGELQTAKVAATLKDHGISQPKCLELMAKHYNVLGKCVPLWGISEGADQDRLDKKVDNVYRYFTLNGVGADTAEAEFEDEPLDDLKEVEPLSEDEKQRLAHCRKQTVANGCTPEEAESAKAEADALALREHITLGRPRVSIVPGLMHDALDAVQRHLAKEASRLGNKNLDPIFQRDGKLVRLSRNLLDEDVSLRDHERAALLIVPVTEPWLARRLDRSIEFVGVRAGNPAKKSEEGKQLAPKDAPPALVKSFLADSTRWTVPTLHATIEAPTLRSDGTILDRPGYDEASGLYYDPGDVKFPKIDPNPTREAGAAAMKQMAELLADFPFHDPEGYEGTSLAVALSMLLTGPVRRSLPIAPGYAIDANEAESGKTTLAKLAAALVTGRDVSAHPFADNEEERRKALGTALASGTPVLLFDNVVIAIEGATLDAMLTSANFEDRRLGAHEMLHAPTCVLLICTGNKITIGGDTTSRILLVRLVPDKPLPERKFKHGNLIDHAIGHRPDLVAAVLTALRAYIVHGREETIPGMGTYRFPEWSALIAGALLWYGYADPRRGGDAPREADPVKEAQREVIRAWRRQFGFKTITAQEMAQDHLMKEALAGMIGCRPNEVTAAKLGQNLNKLVGVTLGLKVAPCKLPTPKNRSQQWCLEWVGPDIDPAS